MKAVWTLLSVMMVTVHGWGFPFLGNKHLDVIQHFVSQPGYVAGPEPPANWYNQTVDHFDAENPNRYNQRYFINDTLWDKNTGPVFLYIGGEGALSPFSVVVGHHMELAPLYKALVVAVEHRYYGASYPTSDLSTPNLKYLSSHQALADLAEFHGFFTQKYQLSENHTWIGFGGSYPGNLAAWYRMKFPHLVYGVIASSAPVQAQLNFEGYNEVITQSLSNVNVGGSANCAEAVYEAFSTIDKLSQDSSGLTYLTSLFKSCQPIESSDDVFQLVSNGADIFQSTVQYNSRSSPNISIICKVMLGQSSPLVNLAQLNTMNLDKQHLTCLDNSFANQMIRYQNITIDPSGNGVGLRQWTYQTCAEFGYYQTCDPGTSCVFSPILTLKSNTDICFILFNINAAQVAQKISFTNEYYGSNQPDGSRIVFVNGSVDPWHFLSILADLPNNQTAIYIPDTSHCANMSPSLPTDPIQLINARSNIGMQVGAWIAEAA